MIVPTERNNPESFRARALQVSLTVSDVEASLAWYCDVIGFTVDRRHERNGKLAGVSIKAGDVRILLNQDDFAKGKDRAKGEGFSMQIVTAQNVDDIAQRIRDHGGTLATEPADMPWGARVFRVLDPDGFKIAIAT